jgi:uncharacterized protein (DUF342 family)
MERKKNIFDKIGLLIPGYSGYAEREGRRQCDKILRNKIAAEIYDCEKILRIRLDVEIKTKNTQLMEALEECRKRLNTLSSKIKYAPYGESGFFSDLQLKEEALKEIFNRDLFLMEMVKALSGTIHNMTTEEISNNIRKIDATIDDRNQFIKEYK